MPRLAPTRRLRTDPGKLLEATRSLSWQVWQKREYGASSWWAEREAWRSPPGCRRWIRPSSLPPGWRLPWAHRDALQVLKGSDLDWTYFSPAAMIEPGERTGKFRLGGTRLVANDRGESRISAEDYAVALMDELKNRSLRKQFTAAY